MIQEESIVVQYMKWNIYRDPRSTQKTDLFGQRYQSSRTTLTTLHDQALNSETYFVQPLLFIKNVSGISNCRVQLKLHFTCFVFIHNKDKKCKIQGRLGKYYTTEHSRNVVQSVCASSRFSHEVIESIATLPEQEASPQQPLALPEAFCEVPQQPPIHIN